MGKWRAKQGRGKKMGLGKSIQNEKEEEKGIRRNGSG
jgi:hypothetical protein